MYIDLHLVQALCATLCVIHLMLH